MTEIINKIFNKVYYLYVLSINQKVSTIFYKCVAKLKGVKGLDKNKIIGKLYFFRTPSSNIYIGDHCEFRSITNSNFIGINRYSIISTHTKNAKIVIGKNCGFSGVSIGCREYIKLGDNVLVGANVIITDTDWHSILPGERLTGVPKSKPVIIKNNVFIGVNSIILKGTIIGENSVIGAGSVVSGIIPDNVVAAGNPCKVLKSISKKIGQK